MIQEHHLPTRDEWVKRQEVEGQGEDADRSLADAAATPSVARQGWAEVAAGIRRRPRLTAVLLVAVLSVVVVIVATSRSDEHPDAETVESAREFFNDGYMTGFLNQRYRREDASGKAMGWKCDQGDFSRERYEFTCQRVDTGLGFGSSGDGTIYHVVLFSKYGSSTVTLESIDPVPD